MTLRFPNYENILALGDFNLTANTTSSIKISTSGNSTPDITLTGSGGGSTTNTGTLELNCLEFLIPAVSDWTKSQAVDSISSDNRYIKISGDQTISSNWDFTGAVKVPTVEETDSSTNAASTAYVSSVISTISSIKLDADNTFTGTNTFDVSPVIPTADSGDNSTKAASTAFVTNSISGKANLSGGNTFTGIQLVDSVTDWTTNQVVDAKSSDSRYIQLASTSTQNVSTPLTFSGEINVPTVEVGDNSTNAASTAFVYNSFHAIEGSVTGDISTTGSSIQLILPGSSIQIVFAYTGSGTASITFSSTSGSISPVDIRRNSIWGGSGVETFTLDGGTLTTTGTVVDDTIYTASNDSSAYFIRTNGTVYFLTVWSSGNGARAFMGVHKVI